MEYENPAGRLHQIFQKARQINDNARGRAAWAELLGSNPDNTADLLAKLAELWQTYIRIKELVDRLEISDKEFLLEHFGTIDQVLYQVNLDQPWSAVKQHISDLVVYNLKVCAREFQRVGLDAAIPSHELDALRKKVESLIQQILDSKLESGFKNFLIKNLRMLGNAILDYRISGVDGLVDSLEHAIGAMYVHKGAWDAVKDEPEGKSFMDIIRDFSSATTTALNMGKLLGYPLKILPVIKDTEIAHILLGDQSKS